VEPGNVTTGQAEQEPHQSSQRVARVGIVGSFVGNKEHIYTSERENEGLAAWKDVNQDGSRLQNVVWTSTHHVASRRISFHSIPILVLTDQLASERRVSISGE
jgi:hypothetical protein